MEMRDRERRGGGGGVVRQTSETESKKERWRKEKIGFVDK